MFCKVARAIGLTTLIVCGSLLIRADAQSTQAGWRSLFDGKTMAGWTTIGPVNWSVVDGALAANPLSQVPPGTTPVPQIQGFLRSTEVFSDFELQAEFWAADN